MIEFALQVGVEVLLMNVLFCARSSHFGGAYVSIHLKFVIDKHLENLSIAFK